MTTTINTTLISQAASKIAGACWDDSTESDLGKRLAEVRNTPRLGTDGDLSSVDRDALGLLQDRIEGRQHKLYAIKTGDMIRSATDAEVCDCAVAMTRDGGHGAIAVEIDGEEISCYVD